MCIIRYIFAFKENERGAVPVQRSTQGGEFSSRIKYIEDQFLDGSSIAATKKPKDLLRAIGKIETSDWNVKQINEKIQENQLGRPPAHGKEKVPKWDKEQVFYHHFFLICVNQITNILVSTEFFAVFGKTN